MRACRALIALFPCAGGLAGDVTHPSRTYHLCCAEGKVGVAKVDATEEQALAARFPLTGYPTIYQCVS